MADKKISALTAASTPLAGTEVLPIVQSGATVKVAVSNLTTGRDVAAQSITTSKDASTGFVAANWVNTSTASNTTKVIAQTYTGYDTVGTVKDVFQIQYEPVDPNNVDGNTIIKNRVSDALTTVARYEGINYKIELGNLVIGTSGRGVSLPGDVTWTSGAGSPEGVVTAPVGSLYSRTDGGLLTSLYVKESGTGNTGWAGK